MWLADNWSALQHGDAAVGLSHPRRIMEWFNDQPKEALPATFDSTLRQSLVRPLPTHHTGEHQMNTIEYPMYCPTQHPECPEYEYPMDPEDFDDDAPFEEDWGYWNDEE